MSTHGGARKGAGRKPGSTTRRTREIANAAINYGISPLEVMLKAMRAADAEGDAKGAAFFANLAAPYVHPRLSSVNSKTDVTGQIEIISEFSDE